MREAASLVSVVIPTYNHAQFLPAALDRKSVV
jgi:glycosyltransferase involved in cell wall biosynthesis